MKTPLNCLRQLVLASLFAHCKKSDSHAWGKKYVALSAPKSHRIFLYPSATGCNSWGFSCWQPILYYEKDPYRQTRKGSRPDSFSSTERAEKNGHPCPKPIGQSNWLLNRCSFAGEKILDPFMGSGTTGVVCAANDRDFIGIEKDISYFRIAEDLIKSASAKYGTFLELFR